MSTASKARNRKKLLNTAQRDKQLIEMAMAGCTWQVISDKLGFGGSGNAHRAWKRILLSAGPTEATKEDARALAQMRMNKLLEAVWKDAVGGSLAHWDKALRALEKYITFWGLDAPKQQQNTDVHLDIDPSTLTDEQIDQLARGILPASLAGGRRDGEASPAARQEPDPGGEEPPGDVGD